MKTERRASLGAATVIMTLLCHLPPAFAAGVMPAQFISKMYSEALGRSPDATGWEAELTYFNANDCTAANLKARGRAFYLSTEYSNLSYDNAARILTVYRGILSMEPSQTDFDNNLTALDGGTLTWAQFVDAAFDTSYFTTTLTPQICNTTGNDASAYYFSYPHAAPALPTSGSGQDSQSGSALQAVLDAAPAGATIELKMKAVISLTAPLTIPAGKTLQTNTQPGTAAYAKMARLVRASNFNGDSVVLQPGAKLKNVWFDGRFGKYNQGCPSACVWNTQSAGILFTGGGAGTTLQNSRISGSNGYRAFYAQGAALGPACTAGAGNQSIVSGNVVTAYEHAHYGQGGVWYGTDGISTACENTSVSGNTVIDATDVAIIMFSGSSSSVQKSQVTGNVVFNAGQSVWSSYAAEPPGAAVPSTTYDFTGASISGNVAWTSTRAHSDLALRLGSRAWDSIHADSATGIAMDTNQLGLNATLYSRVDQALTIDGFMNVHATGNTGWISLIGSAPRCPGNAIAAAVTAGYASGTIQTYTDTSTTDCAGFDNGDHAP